MDINLSTICSIAAAFLFATSMIWYLIDVAKRRITVSIATYIMLTLVNSSQVVALAAKEVWVVVPFTTVGAVSSFLVLLFALRNKKIYFALLDKLGLAGAFVGFIVWLITQDAAYNIYILNAVIVMAFVPLIVKSFKSPQLESSNSWRLNLVASVLLVCAINSPALYVVISPVRQLICSLLVNVGLYRGRFLKLRRKEGLS